MTRSRRRGDVATEGSVLVVVVALAIVGDLWRRQRAPDQEVERSVVEVVEPDEPDEEPDPAPLDLSLDGE